MKKLIFTLAMTCMAFLSNAQWLADGTALTSTFTMKDINNVSYDMFTMLNSGKHVVIDLSATWCGPCWSYHQSHVLDNYFDKYGPSGTSVKDAQVFLYEVDQATTMADLQGTGGSTQGDWITGTTHPICNEASTGTVLMKFLAPGTTSYGVPAVFVVCKDKKLYQVSTGLTSEPGLRNYIASKCGVAPLANEEVMDIDFSYNIYPNPSSSATTIHVNLDKSNTISYSVSNSLGQVVFKASPAEFASGTKDLEINTAGLSEGLYFVNLQVGNRMVKTKLIIVH
jgi:hypothetical protein